MGSARFNGLERLDPCVPSVVSSDIYPRSALPGKPYVMQTKRLDNDDRYLQLPALR